MAIPRPGKPIAAELTSPLCCQPRRSHLSQVAAHWLGTSGLEQQGLLDTWQSILRCPSGSGKGRRHHWLENNSQHPFKRRTLIGRYRGGMRQRRGCPQSSRAFWLENAAHVPSLDFGVQVTWVGIPVPPFAVRSDRCLRYPEPQL